MAFHTAFNAFSRGCRIPSSPPKMKVKRRPRTSISSWTIPSICIRNMPTFSTTQSETCFSEKYLAEMWRVLVRKQSMPIMKQRERVAASFAHFLKRRKHRQRPYHLDCEYAKNLTMSATTTLGVAKWRRRIALNDLSSGKVFQKMACTAIQRARSSRVVAARIAFQTPDVTSKVKTKSSRMQTGAAPVRSTCPGSPRSLRSTPKTRSTRPRVSRKPSATCSGETMTRRSLTTMTARLERIHSTTMKAESQRVVFQRPPTSENPPSLASSIWLRKSGLFLLSNSLQISRWTARVLRR
mmetsp:Transcript_8624/g.19677  ORF Transcript_8624/g.19677 Transcript_8624/m.19677 type:complete len:296 (+) Transcript_8624:321-1208(+)